MSAPSYSDSPGSPTGYLGQTYRYTPTYIRPRNPTVLDTRPKENQGFYPIGSIWINTSTPPEIWILARIFSNNAVVNAEWVLIANSLISGPLLTLSDNGGTVVPPSSDVANPPGNIHFIAGAGITIVGNASANTITITNTGSASTETLTGDDGVAVAASGGTIQTLGNTVANATHAKPLYTTNSSGNIERFDIQVSAAIASTNVNSAGLAAFSNAQFAVDANGFVTLIGGTTAPILGITPDAHTAPGTTPVVPNGSGNIILEGGATFATGTQAHPIRTNSLAANTIDLQIQLAGANAASSTANNFGVAQFDSNSFGVSSGFVTLNNAGTTGAVTKLIGDDSQAIVPSSGAITLTGVTVANATHAKPVYFVKNATSIEELDVQIATTSTSGAKSINNAGLASFDSNFFTVDSATGWISLQNSAVLNIDLDAGTSPIAPSANVLIFTGAQVATGVVGTNVIRTDGSAANEMVIQIQRSTTSAVSNVALNGVSHFDSSKFSVDANGFVTFTGSVSNMPWTDEGGNFAAASNNGYFCTAALTATLPPTPAQGDIIRVVVDTGSTVTIQANTGQKIRVGNTISISAGTAINSKQGDAIDLVYRSASAVWYAFESPVGSWGIT
jgi:hypothetical protein